MINSKTLAGLKILFIILLLIISTLVSSNLVKAYPGIQYTDYQNFEGGLNNWDAGSWGPSGSVSISESYAHSPIHSLREYCSDANSGAGVNHPCPPGYSDYSIDCWIYVKQRTDFWASSVIGFIFEGAFPVGWNPYADNGSYAYTGKGDNGHSFRTTVGLPKNSWHHVKVTYYTTDATFSIWVNNEILHDRIKSGMNPGQPPERYTVYIASAGNNMIIEQYVDDITVSPVSPYTITASAGEGGSISPSGQMTVNQGASQTFTITADFPYMVSGVQVDGTSVGAVSTYTFNNVTTNHIISASFTINAALLSNQTSHSSSTTGPSAPQGLVSLPNVVVQSASLSASKVTLGLPVTVSARVENRGTVNGTTNIKLYVNGHEETSKGVTVGSGSNTPVTFTISRNEPGAYTVYVGEVSAGSFTVDGMADSNIVLYISVSLIFIALIGGTLFLLRRRQPEY